MIKQNNSSFLYSFEGFIWKIQIDWVGNFLVVEIRNEDTREVSFSAIDLKKKVKLWTYKSAEELWWLGLSQVGWGKTVLSSFEGYENPSVKGTEILDNISGRLLWKSTDFTPSGLAKDGLFLKSTDNETVFLEFDSLEVKRVEIDKVYQNTTAEEIIVYPERYSSENIYFPKLSEFVNYISQRKPVEIIEYLEFGHKIIVSFYSIVEEKLVNYLFVTDETGNVLMEEKLGDALKGLASETFFLSGDLLIFVKNRKELVIFEL